MASLLDNPLISVVIVTYNSAPLLRPTLDALFAQDYTSFEAILVDNASRDDSLAIARQYESRGLRVLANPTNRGFSGGNNDGVRASRGELVFLLNPDAIMDANCLTETVAAFRQRPDMGILGAKLLADDGMTLMHCGGAVGFPAHGTIHGRGERDFGQHNTPMEVDFVIGAALAIPRGLWDRLGGFDEDFNPAYFEDTDLCLRCRRMGKKVLYWPAVRLIHHENITTEFKSPSFWWMHHRNRLWFTAKNTPAAALLFKALPAEAKWYASPNAAGLRCFMLRVYWAVIKKYVKRKILRIKK